MIFELGTEYTADFVVNTKTYQGFLAVFNDHNPLHTDSEFAQNKGFKDKVMHGNILNGFMSFFIGEKLPTKNVIIHSQDIQFKSPVYENDELKLSAKVVGIYESVNAVEFKYSFKNSESKLVAKGKFQIGVLK